MWEEEPFDRAGKTYWKTQTEFSWNLLVEFVIYSLFVVVAITYYFYSWLAYYSPAFVII